jgi:heterodisulfide reductase subunit B
MNVEVYQDKINATYGTRFNIPVTYYSTLISVDMARAANKPASMARLFLRKSWKKSPASKFRKISYSLIHKL